MKILVVAKSFSKGGAASGASNLVDSLKVAGAEVVELSADCGLDKKKKMLRFLERVVERLFFNAEIHCLKFGSSSFSLLEAYEEVQPDIIQLCDVSANLVDFQEFKKIPCPVVHRLSDFWPYHGAHHYEVQVPYKKSIANYFLKKKVFKGNQYPDLIIAPSEWICNLLKLPVDVPIKIILNSVKATGVSLLSEMVVSSKIRFGFIAGNIFDPRKGFDLLKCRLQFLVDLGYEVEVHLYGKVKSFKAPILRGVDVISHGNFSRTNLYEVFDSFDILLCPSRLDNSPNVVCEALAHGRPVIGQSGTGIESYLSRDVGFLHNFKETDRESKKEFLMMVLEIRKKYSEYSASAISYTKTTLAPLVVGQQYIAAYESLLKDH